MTTADQPVSREDHQTILKLVAQVQRLEADCVASKAIAEEAMLIAQEAMAKLALITSDSTTHRAEPQTRKSSLVPEEKVPTCPFKPCEPSPLSTGASYRKTQVQIDPNPIIHFGPQTCTNDTATATTPVPTPPSKTEAKKPSPSSSTTSAATSSSVSSSQRAGRRSSSLSTSNTASARRTSYSAAAKPAGGFSAAAKPAGSFIKRKKDNITNNNSKEGGRKTGVTDTAATATGRHLSDDFMEDMCAEHEATFVGKVKELTHAMVESSEEDAEKLSLKKLDLAKQLLLGNACVMTDAVRVEVIRLVDALVKQGDDQPGNAEALLRQVSSIDWAKEIATKDLVVICAQRGQCKYLEILLSVPGVNVDAATA